MHIFSGHLLLLIYEGPELHGKFRKFTDHFRKIVLFYRKHLQFWFLFDLIRYMQCNFNLKMKIGKIFFTANSLYTSCRQQIENIFYAV